MTLRLSSTKRKSRCRSTWNRSLSLLAIVLLLERVGNLMATVNGPRPTRQEVVQFNLSASRFKTGSWGEGADKNQWIPPPGWKYFSDEEIRQMLRGTSIHFFGDSTARRTAITLKMMLDPRVPKSRYDDNGLLDDLNGLQCEETKCPHFRPCCGMNHLIDASNEGGDSKTEVLENVENQNRDPKKRRAEPLLSFGTQYCTYSIIATMRDLLESLRGHLKDATTPEPAFQTNADVIVIAYGTWEEGNKRVCGKYRNKANYTEGLIGEMKQLFEVTNEYQKLSNKTILWRTNGFFDSGKLRTDTALVRRFNKESMQFLEEYNNPGFTYVNYGAGIEPRSFGRDRIGGGHVAHYGFQVRIVAIQMLVNQLVDLGVVRELPSSEKIQ